MKNNSWENKRDRLITGWSNRRSNDWATRRDRILEIWNSRDIPFARPRTMPTDSKQPPAILSSDQSLLPTRDDDGDQFLAIERGDRLKRIRVRNDDGEREGVDDLPPGTRGRICEDCADLTGTNAPPKNFKYISTRARQTPSGRDLTQQTAPGHDSEQYTPSELILAQQERGVRYNVTEIVRYVTAALRMMQMFPVRSAQYEGGYITHLLPKSICCHLEYVASNYGGIGLKCDEKYCKLPVPSHERLQTCLGPWVDSPANAYHFVYSRASYRVIVPWCWIAVLIMCGDEGLRWFEIAANDTSKHQRIDGYPHVEYRMLGFARYFVNRTTLSGMKEKIHLLTFLGHFDDSECASDLFAEYLRKARSLVNFAESF